jgi:hypothetical protein
MGKRIIILPGCLAGGGVEFKKARAIFEKEGLLS